ncbi:MAG: hypothetical protein BWY21_00456 [Parcubacteria group bacterium ADurb.Bin216]|nr:MAG: hypothetical protein BWY21_00456 [Parcubacteria group bacterium ADurb.Bin216]
MRPKVENMQHWLVIRNDGKLFVISTHYKKTSWLGIDAAFFNSKARFRCFQVDGSQKLTDQLEKVVAAGVRIVFTKWEDGTGSKNPADAIGYSVVWEDTGETVFSMENARTILEI